KLQQLIGRRLKDPTFDVLGEMRRDDVIVPQPELIKAALSRRPDYLADVQSQVRSRADLRLQLANGKFDYSVGVEFTRQSAWGVAGNSMGVSLSVPLRVFNKNQGEIARAQREINLAGARTEALQSVIETEVERAYRQYAVSKQLLTGLESDMLNKA